MPRISNFEILQKIEQPTLFIRTKTRIENLPMLIGESYEKMAAYLKEMGEYLSEVPYVAYHNLDMQNLDVEIGFPVDKVLSGQGDIQTGSIPAGKVVFCMYRGAYSDIEAVYAELSQWIEDNDYKSVGTFYEYYYNGPGFPESELLTRIVIPLL